jgi:hypothetical protein
MEWWPWLALAAGAAGIAWSRERKRSGRRPQHYAGVSMAYGSGYPIEGFFSAAEGEIEKDVVENGPGPKFEGVEARMLSPVEVATLGEIVGAGAYDPLLDETTATDRQAGHGECGVFAVPSAIQERLAAADVDDVARQWSQTDELSAAGWTYEDAREVVADLRTLAAQATSAGKRLWVWWTL